MYDNNLPVAVAVIQSFLVSKTFSKHTKLPRTPYQLPELGIQHNIFFSSNIFQTASPFDDNQPECGGDGFSVCSKYRRLVNIIIQVVQYLRNPRERNLSSRALMEVYYTNSRCLTLMFCSKIRTVVAAQLRIITFHYRCSRMLICFFTR